MAGPTAIRLPAINKIFFTADHIGLQAIGYFRQSWILFFLAPPVTEGFARVPDVPLFVFTIDARVLAGILIFAGRFVDAFTDPVIGWWSDRTHSRWGRRIPFILFSTPFYGLFAALVWFLPTEEASWWNVIYFLIVLEIFFTAGTMSSGALEALIPEITHGPRDRMNLVGLIFLFAIVGATVGLVASGPIVDLMGFKAMGIILAVLGVVFRYMSLAAVWRYAPRQTTPARVPFFRGIRETVGNPQFIYYLPTFIMFATGVGVMQGWIPFFTTQLLGAEEEGKITGLIFSSVIGGAVVSGIVLWILLGRGIVSKRRAYGFCLVASAVAFPLLGLVGLFTQSRLVTQALALAFVAGMPMSAVFLLPKAITADVADYDAILNRERREALFYSTQNFFEKVTYALPPLLLSLILLLGDSADNLLGIRLAPLMAGMLVLAGFVLWPRYRLPDTVTAESVAAAGLDKSVRR